LTVDLHSSSDELPGSLARIALTEQYTTLIANSRHPREIEAAIDIACKYKRQLNDAYVQYLSGSAKATPGYENRSPRYREAETPAFASAETLAAVLGARYPSPNGLPPIKEAQQLIGNRVGPLCTGWTDKNTNALTHHPKDQCPVHG
jgi:hypothetical protein